jgi:hypothetical protein
MHHGRIVAENAIMQHRHMGHRGCVHGELAAAKQDKADFVQDSTDC